VIRKLQLDGNLPLFVPKARHAILVNNYDRYPGYFQEELYSRGNQRVYGLEAVLTGKIDPDPDSKKKDYYPHLVGFWQQAINTHGRYRSAIVYDSVTRILPTIEMGGRLVKTLAEVAQVSDEDTLTFIYVTSHGNPGSFAIDNDESMAYGSLLDSLDKIRGKKVVVTFACYSGSLIEELERRTAKEEYIALVSASSSEEGSNWGEDVLHELLRDDMSVAGRMSDIRLPEVTMGHHPQIAGSYDAIL
jgi:hypothetical protein